MALSEKLLCSTPLNTRKTLPDSEADLLDASSEDHGPNVLEGTSHVHLIILVFIWYSRKILEQSRWGNTEVREKDESHSMR